RPAPPGSGRPGPGRYEERIRTTRHPKPPSRQPSRPLLLPLRSYAAALYEFVWVWGWTAMSRNLLTGARHGVLRAGDYGREIGRLHEDETARLGPRAVA